MLETGPGPDMEGAGADRRGQSTRAGQYNRRSGGAPTTGGAARPCSL